MSLNFVFCSVALVRRPKKQTDESLSSSSSAPSPRFFYATRARIMFSFTGSVSTARKTDLEHARNNWPQRNKRTRKMCCVSWNILFILFFSCWRVGISSKTNRQFERHEKRCWNSIILDFVFVLEISQNFVALSRMCQTSRYQAKHRWFRISLSASANILLCPKTASKEEKCKRDREKEKPKRRARRVRCNVTTMRRLQLVVDRRMLHRTELRIFSRLAWPLSFAYVAFNVRWLVHSVFAFHFCFFFFYRPSKTTSAMLSIGLTLTNRSIATGRLLASARSPSGSKSKQRKIEFMCFDIFGVARVHFIFVRSLCFARANRLKESAFVCVFHFNLLQRN